MENNYWDKILEKRKLNTELVDNTIMRIKIDKEKFNRDSKEYKILNVWELILKKQNNSDKYEYKLLKENGDLTEIREIKQYRNDHLDIFKQDRITEWTNQAIIVNSALKKIDKDRKQFYEFSKEDIAQAIFEIRWEAEWKKRLINKS